MKLGFKRGSHWYTYLIRFILSSDWSHAAIAIERPEGVYLCESVALKGTQPKAGVRCYLLPPLVAAEYAWKDLSTDDDDAAWARFKEREGKAYDYFSLIAFKNIPFRDSKRDYCFELVAHMLGLEFTGRVNAEKLLFFTLMHKV